MKTLSLVEYEAQIKRTQAKRLKWWHDARFGMFVHWGLYAQPGRHEWVMNRERIPLAEYEKLAKSWKPKPRAARDWARLAKAAGMKYMVMTTKHHEGFCLWDTKQHDYNAARQGPGRDLVREYVEACREFGLKIGFYYSLMDWHHSDGARCATDERARRRFVDFTRGCVRELMSNYGKIDILWYDVAWPLAKADQWESSETNQMARDLQPHLIINNRSCLDEDFGTPEEHIQAAGAGRPWEACMTFNGSWGWQPCPSEDWLSTRKVLDMLRTCTAAGGNLLLNVGPQPDGSLPQEAIERLTQVGKWLKSYGEAVYGGEDRAENFEWMPTGAWTRKGDKFHYWVTRWPGKELAIGGLTEEVRSARLLPAGKALAWQQSADRLVLHGLPSRCPDKIAQVGMIELKFKAVPRQLLGAGCVLLSYPPPAAPPAGKWMSPFVASWKMSQPVPKSRGGIAAVPCVKLADDLDWQLVTAGADGFVNVHVRFELKDGIAYLANSFQVENSGVWTVLLGHDGGIRLFVDGKSVLCDPKRLNPATPGRSRVTVPLKKGTHEIVVALDTDRGMGWGIFFQFEIPAEQRQVNSGRAFPALAKSWVLA